MTLGTTKYVCMISTSEIVYSHIKSSRIIICVVCSQNNVFTSMFVHNLKKQANRTGTTLLLLIAFFSTYSLHKLSPPMIRGTFFYFSKKSNPMRTNTLTHTPSPAGQLRYKPRLFFSDRLANQKVSASTKNTTKPNKNRPPGKLTRSQSIALNFHSLFLR